MGGRIAGGDTVTRRSYIPRSYQTITEDYLLDKSRCGIWAFMGAGKTVAGLTALDKLFICGHETKPALVCAPLRVAQSTWPDEALKWEHLSGMEVQPITGTEAERKIALTNTHASVFTINYENIPWLIEKLEGKFPFGRIFADESTKLKSFRLRQGTQRARALASVAHSKATGFHNLTGTPSPNGLKDLWGQTWFLDKGERLGRTFSAFQQRWFQTGFDGYSLKPLPYAQEQIQERLKDICLSLNAADYFDLKEPIVVKVYVDLPPGARRTYNEMEKKMFTEIEGDSVQAFNAAARTNKCLQIANGAVYIDPDTFEDTQTGAKQWKEIHNVKLDALEDIIEEAAGMPVLVAYHFRSDLERLRRAFPKSRVLDSKPQTVRDWNAGRIPILLAHPASAGHGLNLQDGGNILIFFGHSWDLELYMQILERIGPVRQMQSGHNRNVFIYYILARDTVDEDVITRRETKKAVQDILLDALRFGRRAV